MKIFVLFLLFLWSYIPASYSQIIKDTIFIQFHEETDLIKKNKEGNTNIWLYNFLYEEELKQYKKEIEKYKNHPLPPPSIFSPVKPNRYYKYFLTDEPSLCCNKIGKKDCNEWNFYDRKDLKILNPYKKLIFVVKVENDSILCFPVSFYKNVRE